MEIRKYLFVLLIAIFLTSCEAILGKESFYSTTNKEKLTNLIKLLEKREIPHQYKNDRIYYKNEYKNQFRLALEALSSTISIQHKDADVRKYFRSLLDKEGIEYIALNKDDGTWTMWWPKNEEQEHLMEMKAVDYAFNNMKGITIERP